MRSRGSIAVLAAWLVLAAGAPPVDAAVPATCGLAAPDIEYKGSFGAELEGSYVLLPFDVPLGHTAVRIRYCFDQPVNPQLRNTLDLDVYGPRAPGSLWGPDEFRGSSGSARREGDAQGAQVTLSTDGFDAKTGPTTPSMRPGRATPGEWAVQLPVAAIVDRAEGGNGEVAFRVQIELIDDREFADEPYEPAPYDRSPARGPGWYAGDLHVHADHSEGSATMREAFDFAFRPIADGGAGLDFVSLTDHNTDSALPEIGRFQPDYPGRTIMRGTEVTTFRGHLMNHATGRYVDHRTGPVYEANIDPQGNVGALTLRRPARPASSVLADIDAAGGLNQINHPTIFPSEVPGFANLCRGCSWAYSDDETGYGDVDAIEIATGPAGLDLPPLDPGPNPFTVTAIGFWEDKLAKGHKIAPVGVSDAHDAGRAGGPTEAPIGQATTVIYADELSERGIREAIQAGHTYVKVGGNAGPDLRFEARTAAAGRSDASAGQAAPAIMGDTVRAESVGFLARVLGAGPDAGGPSVLAVIKDGTPILALPVTSDDFSAPFASTGPGRYRLQLQRSGTTIDAVSSPIYVEPAQGPAGGEGLPGGRGGEGGGDGDDPTRGGDPNRGDGADGGRSLGGGPTRGADSGPLPFTGVALGLVALAGALSLGLGLAVRRIAAGGGPLRPRTGVRPPSSPAPPADRRPAPAAAPRRPSPRAARTRARRSRRPR